MEQTSGCELEFCWLCRMSNEVCDDHGYGLAKVVFVGERQAKRDAEKALLRPAPIKCVSDWFKRS
jgi:hypothetical protein